MRTDERARPEIPEEGVIEIVVEFKWMVGSKSGGRSIKMLCTWCFRGKPREYLKMSMKYFPVLKAAKAEDKRSNRIV